MVRDAIVAVVVSVWRSGKKPQLTTKPLDLAHVLAYRVIELVPGNQSNQMTCDGASTSWVLRVEAAVALLGFEKVEDSDERFAVTLNAESCNIVENKDDFAAWWPQETGELLLNVFLPRQGRKRNRAKAKEKNADDPSEVVEKSTAEEVAAGPNKKEKKHKGGTKKHKKKKKKGQENAEGQEEKKKKKKQAARLKAAKADAEIPMLPENFRKSVRGEALIQQELSKLKNADKLQFKDNPVFNSENKCRVKAEKTDGVPWEHIVQSAMVFFKSRYLGIP